MPRNGSGTYSLPAGNPVVTGTTVQSSWANNTLTDIASAITASLPRDGQAAMTGDLPMGGMNINNAAAITANGQISGGSLTVTGTSIPANGLYLPSANTLGLAAGGVSQWTMDSTGLLSSTSTANDERVRIQGTGSPYLSIYRAGSRIGLVGATAGGIYLYGDTGAAASLYAGGVQRFSVASTGNATIGAPSAGITLDATSVAGANLSFRATSPSGSGNYAGVSFFASGVREYGIFAYTTDGSLYFQDITAGAARGTISSVGAWVLNAPSSGNTLTINQFSSTPGIRITNGSGDLTLLATGGQSVINTPGAWGLDLQTNSVTRLGISSTGNVSIGAPSSGDALSVTGTIAATGIVTGIRVPIVAFKSAATDRSSTTTLAADPDLVVGLQSGKSYTFEVHLRYRNASGTPGINASVGYSSTSTATTSHQTGISVTGAPGGVLPATLSTSAAAYNDASPTTAAYGDYVVLKGFIATTGAGNLALYWAQDSSSANAVQVMAGSYMIVTPVN